VGEGVRQGVLILLHKRFEQPVLYGKLAYGKECGSGPFSLREKDRMREAFPSLM